MHAAELRSNGSAELFCIDIYIYIFMLLVVTVLNYFYFHCLQLGMIYMLVYVSHV